MTAVAAPVRDRPILMSSSMVRATLEDRKTKTRRVAMTAVGKPSVRVPLHIARPAATPMDRNEWGEAQRHLGRPIAPDHYFPFRPNHGDRSAFALQCPYGRVGDRLWVRETALYLRPIAGDDSIGDVMYADHEDYDVCYPANPNGKNGRRQTTTSIDLGWRLAPSIFMPRWASRLTLEITDVLIERLQDISEDDAIDEGVEPLINDPLTDGYGEWKKPYVINAREQFRALWDSLNAKRGYGWDVNPWVWVLSFKRVTP